jgi:hypothetical protein
MNTETPRSPLNGIDSHKQVIQTGIILIVMDALWAFAHLFAQSTGEWLTVDYLSNGSMLAFMLFAQYPRHCIRKSLQPLRRKWELLGMTYLRLGSWIVLALALMMLTNIFVWRPLMFLLPDTHFVDYPGYDEVWMYWIDMTFGLALVAVTEEFMFRSVCKEIVGKYITSNLAIILITSLAFALVHWRYGIPNMVGAFIAGIIFMILRMKSRSVVPPIITHYLFNVWVFG